MPKVSIITPCYNAEKFVGRTIESVRAQTFEDWEHIVVDDGSTDGSHHVVEASIQVDPRLRIVRQANGGLCSARNAGYKAAARDSEYLYFLDADDCIEPTMLDVMVRHMDEHPGVGIATCNYIYIDEEDRPLATTYLSRYLPTRFGIRELSPEHYHTPFVSLFFGAPIMASLSVLRRSVYEQTPGWDEAFGMHMEDADLFLHFALKSEIHLLPHKLYRYRRHSNQSTADTEKFDRQVNKLYAKWLNMPGLTSEERKLVRTAWRVREGRLIPWMGFQAGNRHLRRGELKAAARFYVGAVKRYTRSFLPLPTRPPRSLPSFSGSQGSAEAPSFRA
jgi:glycosyltransferase involved in cell wall biosynthesis